MTDQELELRYDDMWAQSYQKLKQEEYYIDPNLKKRDDRMGITLRLSFGDDPLAQIDEFQDELKSICPEQYHYSQQALHMTVLSVISCSVNNDLIQLQNYQTYVDVIQEVLKDEKPFRIRHQGLTLGNAGLLIQGFPEADALNLLREKLRVAIHQSGVYHTLDTRYKIWSAHSTVMRYRERLVDRNAYLAFLEKSKSREFGVTTVGRLELVINDWCHSPEQTEMCASWELK
ncbi:mutarotase [Reichenbachiella ulvae]|uniref:Mutarotase n=1 Tax=Reichenbachiella ulvae TaxID=2980104 RepID=A0ABT3CYZ8_9BACT|nr:mutarotase [Reichenbachiella ulvae]MCV9388744.1 mutarotase [Reichenbachiella ulvae]